MTTPLRKSRARKPINWDYIFSQINGDTWFTVPIPAHLSAKQMAEKLVEVAKSRGVDVDYTIIMGKLEAWIKVPAPDGNQEYANFNWAMSKILSLTPEQAAKVREQSKKKK